MKKTFNLMFFMLLISSIALAQTPPPATTTPPATPPQGGQARAPRPKVGDILVGIGVHDPVIIKQDSLYYVFCTGNGISIFSSKDLVHWKIEKQVFDTAPAWIQEAIPSFRGNGEWAPDISYNKGTYYLYYAASAFGKNTSVIGVATNTTLHTDDPKYKWVDQGMVIKSIPGVTNWNAIDPNLAVDNDGTPYLDFGSFWEGLKIVKLTKDRLHVDGPIDNLPTIASRLKEVPAVADGTPKPEKAGPDAIEGPFIFKKSGYFYLFASIDYCCKGPQSTYKMIVGRSKKITGPYLDSKGNDMKFGGGDLLLQGDANWYGVGHNGVATFDGNDYIVFHGYDAVPNAQGRSGDSKIIIEKITWTKGWPSIPMPVGSKELYAQK